MYQRLEQVLGPEEASTLMEHLPPVGWADVATKRDLEHLSTVLRLEWRAELQRGLRTQLLAILGFNLATTGLVLGVLG